MNCVDTINVIKNENKSALWIKMHNIKGKFCVKNMCYLTIKAAKGIYNTKKLAKRQTKNDKSYGTEFIDNMSRIYIRENLALSIIMDFRTPTAIEFRSKLRFKQHDLITTKEQSVLTRIMKEFSREKILLQHSVLSYRIDLYFPRHKLAIQIDEKGHKDIDKEFEGSKATEKEIDCKFIIINPDEKDEDMDIHISKIHNQIIE